MVAHQPVRPTNRNVSRQQRTETAESGNCPGSSSELVRRSRTESVVNATAVINVQRHVQTMPVVNGGTGTRTTQPEGVAGNWSG